MLRSLAIETSLVATPEGFLMIATSRQQLRESSKVNPEVWQQTREETQEPSEDVEQYAKTVVNKKLKEAIDSMDLCPTALKYAHQVVDKNFNEAIDSIDLKKYASQVVNKKLKEVIYTIDHSPTALKSLFVINPEEMIGPHYTSKGLKQYLKGLGLVVSVANIIDFCCIQGLLYALFPGGLALPASLTFNLLLLKFKNDTAAGVVKAVPGTLPARLFYTVGFLGLSSISAGVSGIGTELSLNQPGLVQIYASELADRKINEIQSVFLQAEREYKEKLSQCNDNKKELENISKKPGFKNSDPHYNVLYRETKGMLSESKKQWRINDPGIPLCPKAKLLKEVFDVQSKPSLKIQIKRRESDDDLSFLKTDFPNLFAKNFIDNDQFRSGSQAIKIATINFNKKLSEGDLGGLGGSLFLFSISAVTTIAACGAVLASPLCLDSRLSFDDSFGRDINNLKQKNSTQTEHTKDQNTFQSKSTNY
jgi:hypothetical protein